MATLSKGYTFGATETVTNAKLHSLVDSATISGIVNADVDNAAAIGYSKLADIDGSKLIGLANIPSGSGEVPVANIPTGTTANKVVKLDSNAKIPAVDGSLLTGGVAIETTWTDYGATSVIVGWSSYTTKLIYTKKIGKIVFVCFDITGTSNSTTTTFTVPYTSANTTVKFGGAMVEANDNGVTLTVATQVVLAANGSNVNCFTNMAAGAWTASGNKAVRGAFWYEAA